MRNKAFTQKSKKKNQKKWSTLSEYTLKHLPNRLMPTVPGSCRHLLTLEPVLAPLEEKILDKKLKRSLKTQYAAALIILYKYCPRLQTGRYDSS